MSAHTDGPWIFGLYGEPGMCITTVAHCERYVIGLDSSPIEGGNYRDGEPSGDPKADARLIAAAPELLTALMATRGQWIHSVNKAICLAAIAKATEAT